MPFSKRSRARSCAPATTTPALVHQQRDDEHVSEDVVLVVDALLVDGARGRFRFRPKIVVVVLVDDELAVQRLSERHCR
jgi:dephospho-CoA kinase